MRAAAASGLGRYVLAGEMEELEAPVLARIMSELLTAIHLQDEDVEVRRRAIESAAYACTAEVNEAIEMAYYDEDERLRHSAIVGMGRSCDRRWKPIILQELDQRPDAAMRFQAAWASGELALKESVPILARLIDDPDLEVCNCHHLGPGADRRPAGPGGPGRRFRGCRRRHPESPSKKRWPNWP